MNANLEMEEIKMDCESLDIKSEGSISSLHGNLDKIAVDEASEEKGSGINVKNGEVLKDNSTKSKLKRKRVFLNQSEAAGNFGFSDGIEDDNFAPAAKYREIEGCRKFVIEDFSDEVLFEIVKYLDTWSLMSLMICSARLRGLVLDHRLWTFIDLKKAPLPLGILEDILERTNINTKVVRIRGPSISQHLENEGIQFSQTLAETFSNRCKHLVELELQGITIDTRYVRFSDFPKTLERLRLIQCAVRIPGNEKSIFSGLDTHLKQLEELALEYNDWFEPYFIMMLSKVPKLRKLSLKGCNALVDFVPYGSMAARFGFKALEILDLRHTPISDSDLQCFNAVRTLKEILLDCPKDMRKNATQKNEKESGTSKSSKSNSAQSSTAPSSSKYSVTPSSSSTPAEASASIKEDSTGLISAEASTTSKDSGNQGQNITGIDLDGPSTSAAARLSCRGIRVSLAMSRSIEQPENNVSNKNKNNSDHNVPNNDQASGASDSNLFHSEQKGGQNDQQSQQQQDIPQFDDSTSSNSSSSNDAIPTTAFIANSSASNSYPVVFSNNNQGAEPSGSNILSYSDLLKQRRRHQHQHPQQGIPQFDDSTSNSSSSSSSESSPTSGSIANSPEPNLFPRLSISNLGQGINGGENNDLPRAECNIRADQVILLDVRQRRGHLLRPMIRFRQRPNPLRCFSYENYRNNNNNNNGNNNNGNNANNSNSNNNNGFEQVVNHPMFWNMLNPIGRASFIIEESRRRHDAASGQGRGAAEAGGIENNVFGRIRVGRGPCISIYQKDFTSSRRKPISDRGICSFGRPRHPVDQQIVWISVASRPSETSLERISVRNYELVTDISLHHLVQCSPNLVHLDLSGTSVTANGVRRFKELKPNCRVIADHLVMDSSANDGGHNGDHNDDRDDNDDDANDDKDDNIGDSGRGNNYDDDVDIQDDNSKGAKGAPREQSDSDSGSSNIDDKNTENAMNDTD